MATAIKIENLSKQYRLGLVSTRTLSHDLNRWWQTNILKKDDPYLKIGDVNDRTIKGSSEYVWALKDINVEVQEGEVLGIIGKNGAGKSTLLKILSKVTSPTSGLIKAKGRIASLLEVGTGFHPEMTGRENIFMNGSIMGMSKAEINRKFDEIVDFAGVERYIDTPVKRYSSGMTVRLGFAIAAHLEPEILVVDEVLAVGDADFQKKAIGKMKDVSSEKGRTVLFVSHNLIAVQQLCKSAILLRDGLLSFQSSTNETIQEYLNNNKTNFIHSELRNRIDRKGSQWLKFTKVIICDTENNIIESVICGQDIVIKIFYESEIELSKVSVLASFNVRNSKNYLLTNLNSVDTGNGELEIFKCGYFECIWPKFNLKSDVYECNLFCSIDGDIVDWLQNAFSISVENGDYYNSGKMIGNDQGEVLVTHSWTSKKFVKGDLDFS